MGDKLLVIKGGVFRLLASISSIVLSRYLIELNSDTFEAYTRFQKAAFFLMSVNMLGLNTYILTLNKIEIKHIKFNSTYLIGVFFSLAISSFLYLFNDRETLIYLAYIASIFMGISKIIYNILIIERKILASVIMGDLLPPLLLLLFLVVKPIDNIILLILIFILIRLFQVSILHFLRTNNFINTLDKRQIGLKDSAKLMILPIYASLMAYVIVEWSSNRDFALGFLWYFSLIQAFTTIVGSMVNFSIDKLRRLNISIRNFLILNALSIVIYFIGAVLLEVSTILIPSFFKVANNNGLYLAVLVEYFISSGLILIPWFLANKSLIHIVKRTVLYITIVGILFMINRGLVLPLAAATGIVFILDLYEIRSVRVNPVS